MADQKVAFLSICVPHSKMSVSCGVTVKNKENVLRLVDEVLSAAVLEELGEKKAPVVAPTEAVNK